MQGALRSARQAELLGGPWSATKMVEITSYLAEGERDKAAQAALRWQRESSGTTPLEGTWPGPFPQALIDRMEEPLRSRLQGSNHAEGIIIVMQELGWNSATGAISRDQ